jgi:uncharacterized protein YdeI (YjbR/CyaY-like superfamily)
MITDIADYFSQGCGRCPRFATSDCSTRTWSTGLSGLRDICLEAGLAETVKWGHPCYMHADRNIAIIGAFRDNFRLSFFNAALMKDADGVLQRQGPNTRHPDMICFRDNDAVAAMAPTIRSYLKESMGYAEARLKPAREPQDLDLPDELVDALDADPALAEAFHGLTPGRQKSYVILLASAKTSATRSARILKARAKILAGKGAQER